MGIWRRAQPRRYSYRMFSFLHPERSLGHPEPSVACAPSMACPARDPRFALSASRARVAGDRSVRRRAAIHGAGRQAPRRAREAAFLADRRVRRTGARWPTAAFSNSSPRWAPRCASRKQRSRADESTEYGAWKKLGMALGHFADIVSRERARRLLHRRSARDLSVDARAGRRATTFGADARADPHRHALARRASRLQHAGDDAQRIARRHARGRRDRTRAAGHATRRASRSAALGSGTS